MDMAMDIPGMAGTPGIAITHTTGITTDILAITTQAGDMSMPPPIGPLTSTERPVGPQQLHADQDR